MVLWDSQVFWSQFAPSALAATAVLGVLALLARWAWTRHWKFVAAGIAWLMMLTFVLFIFALLHPKTPKEVARPYFIKYQPSIVSVTDKDRKKVLLYFLTVAIKNNERPAKNAVSQILILDTRLDPTIAPLFSRRIKTSNDIGNHQFLRHQIPVLVGRKARSVYIVHEVRYEDAVTEKAHSQIWFMKTGVLPQRGTARTLVSDASYNERIRIEAYVRERKIPALAPQDGGA